MLQWMAAAAVWNCWN